MEFVNTVTIDRAPREVFDFLADLENVPRWNYAIVETDKISAGPIGRGSRYRQVRSIPTRTEEELEITEFEPGRRLTVRGDLGPFTGTLTYELEEGDGATVLTNTADLEAHGIMKFAAPLAGSRVRDAVAQNLSVLKDLLERSGQR